MKPLYTANLKASTHRSEDKSRASGLSGCFVMLELHSKLCVGWFQPEKFGKAHIQARRTTRLQNNLQDFICYMPKMCKFWNGCLQISSVFKCIQVANLGTFPEVLALRLGPPTCIRLQRDLQKCLLSSCGTSLEHACMQK